MNKVLGAIVVLALLALVACGGNQDPALEESPTGGSTPAVSAQFESPEDGATVSNPVRLQMAAEGVAIEPAASGVRPNAGHFHVIVDSGCFPEGQVIPNDASHIHYGMGQTEAELTLEPGEHELCLQVADGAHVALPITDTIQITIE